ncbi:hypothetical protein CFC21_090211 [Triticum aestivum]|uniref:DUF295 domain-containing protein n=2 Tax=Triticum aestivum TaxID=4565 RepID=A0A9R1LDQ7_WHEAT|nr:hypothetical protein CFC21_090211 [Triticum aestivum]
MSTGRSISAGKLRHRTRVFVVAQDSGEVGNLVFKINLKHLFSPSPSPSQPEGVEVEPHAQAQLEAVACFKQVDQFESMAFAASASGDVIVAANYADSGRTLIYDAAAGGVSPGPEMRSVKQHLFLVPVGDRMFFAMSAYSRLDFPRGGPWFEALQQRPLPGGGGRWAWSALPDPPGIARGRREDVRAYFVAGARVWISLHLQGTYSFDTARQRWRKEGAWELPVEGRAFLVPDFLGSGRRLLFGICSSWGNRHFCAVDMDARPPAILRSWPEARPTVARAAGYVGCSFLPEVSYFGGGRFCISMTNQTKGENRRSVVSFKAVEVTAELQLIERRSSLYLMPQSSRGSPADVI